MAETVHVFPVGDTLEHVLDGGECVCGPTVEPVPDEDGSMGWVVTHHALDGREHGEPDHDRVACPLCGS